MKYLSDYTEDTMTAALNKHGAFFAFSTSQFEEQRKEGVEYVSMNMGMVCPKENARAITNDIVKIGDDARKQDLAENGAEAIIKRELGNHECYYDGGVDRCIDALGGYGISEAAIIKIYREELPNYDN